MLPLFQQAPRRRLFYSNFHLQIKGEAVPTTSPITNTGH